MREQRGGLRKLQTISDKNQWATCEAAGGCCCCCCKCASCFLLEARQQDAVRKAWGETTGECECECGDGICWISTGNAVNKHVDSMRFVVMSCWVCVCIVGLPCVCKRMRLAFWMLFNSIQLNSIRIDSIPDLNGDSSTAGWKLL